MAITQAVCNSFKKELLVGAHDFDASSGDTFKLALYTSSASLSASTTAFTTSNEVSGTGYIFARIYSLTNPERTISSTPNSIRSTDDIKRRILIKSMIPFLSFCLTKSV